MGAIGFMVKLIHIPINNILVYVSFILGSPYVFSRSVSCGSPSTNKTNTLQRRGINYEQLLLGERVSRRQDWSFAFSSAEERGCGRDRWLSCYCTIFQRGAVGFFFSFEQKYWISFHR